MTKKPTGLLNSGDEIRKLLLDNPTLPLLVFASDDCNSGDYAYMSCSYLHGEVGEFLDCEQEANDERVYTDRDEFEEDLRDYHSDFDGSEDEFDKFIEDKLAEYDPYWKPCVILYIGN